MGIFKKIFIFILLLSAITGGVSYIIYTHFYEHIITIARTPKGRALRLKAEELGLRKRSKEEKWIDRYDYSIELAKKKKEILTNATHRGTIKLFDKIKYGLNLLNPYKNKKIKIEKNNK